VVHRRTSGLDWLIRQAFARGSGRRCRLPQGLAFGRVQRLEEHGIVTVASWRGVGGTRTAIRFVPALAALVLVLAACAPPTSGTPTGDEDTNSMLEVGLRDGSDFQREILGDGVVSPAEYERAFDAAVSCMRDEGLEVVGPFSVMFDRYLMYTVRDTGDSDSISNRCDDEHLAFVRSVWSVQNTPTGQEAERVRTDYRDCARSKGMDLRDGATYEEIDLAAGEQPGAAILACIERYSNNTFIIRAPDG